MTAKSWLRARAEKAAEEWIECGDEWRMVGKNGAPCHVCERRVASIADAIEAVAREFAERVAIKALLAAHGGELPGHLAAQWAADAHFRGRAGRLTPPVPCPALPAYPTYSQERVDTRLQCRPRGGFPRQ